MKTNKPSIIVLLALIGNLVQGQGAEIPPPEKLLPGDTLGLLVVPDWDSARIAYRNSALGQLGQDPSLKPFKEKLLKKLKDDLLNPLERDLGIKFQDYANLFHGQMTLAVTQNGWDRKSPQTPAWLFLLDSKGKKDELAKTLTNLRQNWVDRGKKLRVEKIRDVEFVSLIIDREEMKRSFEKALPPKAKEKSEEEGDKGPPKAALELLIGQSDGLLIVGNANKEIEKLLIRKAGGLASPLLDQAVYQANRNLLAKEALSYFWINASLITEVMSRPAPDADKEEAPQPLAFSAEKLISGLGLKGLKTVVGTYQEGKEGPAAQIYFAVPEANRKGLFKMLMAETKDASPPSFVPADAVKFTRWRVDGKKAWAALEAMLTEISPQMNGVLQMGLSVAGKDKDPNFDLKKTLIGNLGDDFIRYEKAPRGLKLNDLNSAPSLFLIGGSNAEQLARGVRVAATLFPEPMNNVKEREFLGRKVYSLALPNPPAQGQGQEGKGERSLSFVVNAGYVAFSADPALLEEFLRSSETKGKTLRDTAGLKEAAEKVGGMNTGLFLYDNQAETMRTTIETLKQDPEGWTKALALTPFNRGANAEKDKGLTEWLDYKLLPPFEKISRYFHFNVCGGGATADGWSFKAFFPVPPALKK